MTATRLTGVLLLTAVLAMIAGAVLVVPSGLTLNPADPAATLAAVHDRLGLHLTELALDVIGWLALTGAGLVLAARAIATGRHLALPAGGLLAAAGLAGLLHDAGNLAVAQLSDPVAAEAVLLIAKWTVNLAGLLWVAATATAALTGGPRPAGLVAAVSGLAATVLPWTTGTAGPSPAVEQLGYALHLPIMIWWSVLGWRDLRARAGRGVRAAGAERAGQLLSDTQREHG